MFKVNIKGRLKKINIAKNKVLLPLYEAIVNSFHAIEECGEEGSIKIFINRDLSQFILCDTEENKYLYPITGFTIEDNGIGFNDDNYESFLTSDSEYKYSKGAKGIGRFVWLKTFEKAKIESYYCANNQLNLRRFDFVLDDKEPLKELIAEENVVGDRKTVVELINLKKEYKEALPQDISKISMQIIEHCLEFFMRDDCPKVKIIDGATEIDLNEKFQELLANNIKESTICIKGYNFKIVHIKLYELQGRVNRIHYCANNREVKNESLNSIITDLDGRISEGNKSFVYSAYIFSELLDNLVNDERTDFRFNTFEDMLGDGIGITKREIEEKLIEEIKKYLQIYIEPVKEEKIKKIKEYVYTKGPLYRSLIKYKEAELENIKPGLKEDELEIELFKILQNFKIEVKKQGEEFLKITKPKYIQDLDEYKKKCSEYIEKENILGKSALSEYIIHRKVVIDLLENSLNKNEDDKYSLEEYVHNLIFPMRTKSDDVDYEKHNLWLIDERLSYHYYLASDIPMNKIEIIDVENTKRPDVMIMDNPITVTSDDKKPFNSLTIIEFKRPMRDNYTSGDNPIDQLKKYVSDIRKNSKYDKNGRIIKVSDNTAFYLYIIADITNSLEEIALNDDFTKTPDGLGYFRYIKNLNSYIEIISYEKMLFDSQKRNRILFDKLFKH